MARLANPPSFLLLRTATLALAGFVMLRNAPTAPAPVPAPADGPAESTLVVHAVDAATGRPTPCTVSVTDANGHSVTIGRGFSRGFRSWGSTTNHALPPGRTLVRISRGPEYEALETPVDLLPGRTSAVEATLRRRIDLRQFHWYSGDSHAHMLHGEKTLSVSFDDVALAAGAEDLQYLSLAQTWQLENPTPERLESELARRSTSDCFLTWNLEAPKNYYLGDAGRCLGHCWTLGMRGRTPDGVDVIAELLRGSAADYEVEKAPVANFELQSLIRAQHGAVFYTHPARWWTGPWGGQGGYPKQESMRVSNVAAELPLDVLAGPTFDGLDVITGANEFAADQKSFAIWSLLLNHGYRLSATASSDACFDRPGGATPGAARLYTYLPEGFSIASAAHAAVQGRTFATTGPLLLTTVDRKPPGSSLAADGHPTTLAIHAWASGETTNGLSRVEVLRNGHAIQTFTPAGNPTTFSTNLTVRETNNCWYCIRAFGVDEQRQRAISGAFYFETAPWTPPPPVRARVRVQALDAVSGTPLDVTLTEINLQANAARPKSSYGLRTGSGTVTIPATSRLRAEGGADYEPLTLSPLFDNPPLLQIITGMTDNALLDWATYERIEQLLGNVELTFKMKKRSSTSASPVTPNGASPK